MPSLSDVPGVAMNLILSKLNFLEIQCLRKSCRELRHFIDNSKLDSALSQLHIRMNYNHVSLYYRNNDYIAAKGYYYADKQGCRLSWYQGNRRNKKLLENSDFLDIACQDLATVLINQKSALEYFHIDLFLGSLGPDNEEMELKKTSIGFLERMKKNLEFRSQKLKIHTFRTTVMDHHQFSPFFQFLDSDYLNSLVVFNVRGSSKELEMLNISELVRMEHWRKMRTLSIHDFVVKIPVKYLTHFEEVFIAYKVVTIDMVMELKEAFLRPDSLLRFIVLRFEKNDALDTMKEIFGPPLQDADVRKPQFSWFFEIPNSHLNHTINIYKHSMQFKRVEPEKIPPGVIIL